MDKLIIIPIVLLALYFIYRHVKNSIKCQGNCHGDCSRCPKS
ncbi:FeoB-associated Cys-rich membrane protein [Candidatus Poribacteria bacterium]|nr:FeoB-associated Cys-rich membrane protein [Candidatus Poribacteria bacterium]